MKIRLKHRLEYAALVAVVGFVRFLPYRLALAIGWLLALVGFYVVRYRVDEAKRRLREVFGDRLSSRQINRIAWISLRNTFFNAVEIMRMASVDRAWVEKTTDHAVVETFLEQWDHSKGAVLALPHMGNSDLAGVAASTFGVPLFFVTGVQRNPLVNDYLNQMRGVSGIETIPKDSTMLRKVVRKLKDGKVLGFNTDLRSRTPALTIRFLGGEANIVGGMAMFARQADVPIFPVVVTRVGWARHKWTLYDPVRVERTKDKVADWTNATQKVMDLFDAAIRAEPEQYFWYNKRWILDPLEAGSGDDLGGEETVE